VHLSGEAARILEAADRAIGACLWDEAVTLLDHLVSGLPGLGGDAMFERRRVFARNMRALASRDSALCAMVAAAPTTGRIGFMPGEDGRVGVLERTEDGARLHLTPIDIEPLPAEALGERTATLLLEGVGDGRAWSAMCAQRPDALGQRTTTLIVEPDLERFRAALMLSAVDGPDGIAHADRCVLAVGADWADRLRSAYVSDDWLVLPSRTLQSGALVSELAEVLQEISGARERATARLREEVDARWDKARVRGLASLMRGQGSRAARVLILTTRFSTVLQHAARDACVGLREAGCEAQVLIEPRDCVQMRRHALVRELAAFDPDAMMVIGHMRSARASSIPDGMAHLTWVQDNLPHLMTREAGASVAANELVFGAWAGEYVRDFGYPKDRCLELPRLTQCAPAAASSERRERTMVYVSNHSATTEQMRRSVLESVKLPPEGVALVEASLAGVMARYESGRCFETRAQIERVIEEEGEKIGLRAPSNEFLRGLGELLTLRVHNPLYRQQGLRWARQACERLGLTLEIYGQGWASNPEFVPFARGVVSYGDDLAELSRRAGAVLVMEPFFPMSHQRAIDAWGQGAMVLLRRRRLDALYSAWHALLTGALAELSSEAELDRVDAEVAAKYLELRSALEAASGGRVIDDPISVQRARERDGLGWLMQPPPRYDEVAFDDADGLLVVAERVMSEASISEEIRVEQSRYVRERFGYGAGMRRVLDRLGDVLERGVAHEVLADSADVRAVA